MIAHRETASATDGRQPASSAIEDLQAATANRLELLGFRLIQIADGTFIATSPSCCRPLGDLAGARRFAMRAEGER